MRHWMFWLRIISVQKRRHWRQLQINMINIPLTKKTPSKINLATYTPSNGGSSINVNLGIPAHVTSSSIFSDTVTHNVTGARTSLWPVGNIFLTFGNSMPDCCHSGKGAVQQTIHYINNIEYNKCRLYIHSKYICVYQVLPSDLFGWFKWPFQGLSDLHLDPFGWSKGHLEEAGIYIYINICNMMYFPPN